VKTSSHSYTPQLLGGAVCVVQAKRNCFLKLSEDALGTGSPWRSLIMLHLRCLGLQYRYLDYVYYCGLHSSWVLAFSNRAISLTHSFSATLLRVRTLTEVEYLEDIKIIISKLYLVENLIIAFEMMRILNSSISIYARNQIYRHTSSINKFI